MAMHASVHIERARDWTSCLPSAARLQPNHCAIPHGMVSQTTVSHVALQDVVALHDFLWFGWNERFRDTIKDTISWVDSSVLTSPARASG